MSEQTTNPPEWMLAVTPGRLDLRILDQNAYWVTRGAAVVLIADMSTDHLRNVARMLNDMAMLLHLHAMADMILCPEEAADSLVGELATNRLTGSCIATVAPHDWLRATPLLRQIFQELESRR